MTTNTFDQVKMNFEKFLSLIATVLTCEQEIQIIQNKLRRHFNTAISDYLCSNEFLASLERIHNHFLEQQKSTKYYTLLASFDEQLKKHSIKSAKPPTSTSTVEILPIDTSLSEVQETIEYLLNQCCNIVCETLVVDQVTSVSVESKRQRKINRLERRLTRLARIIRELEEKDMSLDEMAHCDLYEVEANLKKEACLVHKKLSKLQSQSANAERILLQPIILNESEIGHPLLNKDLQEMVNQSKNFPSFDDVLRTVEKANDQYQLHLNEEARKTFAEKSFKIIGKQIKDRRMADFQDIMNSRLPEDFNIEQSDPALENAEIEQVLLENQRDAAVKTEKIFEEYSRIDPDPAGEINIESTEEDLGDMPPPPTTQSSPPPPPPQESDSIEAKLEISLNERTFTILSTASLPARRSIHNRESESRPDSPVQTLTPRSIHNNAIIYQLYQQRLTNKSPNFPKRSQSKPSESSTIKKAKPSPQQQPEIIFELNKVRHGIYLSTGEQDDGLIELGKQQAYAAAETIDSLARSLENPSSRILFTHLIESGYKRAYQTGWITGHRLEKMQRLERAFESIYERCKYWGEVHSMERFRERWNQLQRLFFSSSSSKHYLIFTHGNLLTSIISFLLAGGSYDRWNFGNIAPHCSVSVLSYKSGDVYPKIVFTPFQIFDQTLPKTINNVNPRKMRLTELITRGEITEQIWKVIIDSILPERVVGFYTDQKSQISKFIPANEQEARHMLFIFKQYHSQITTNIRHENSDTDDEDN